MDYEAWEAHRELDRMPDPNTNPCESAHRRIEQLEGAIRNTLAACPGWNDMDGYACTDWSLPLALGELETALNADQ